MGSLGGGIEIRQRVVLVRHVEDLVLELLSLMVGLVAAKGVIVVVGERSDMAVGEQLVTVATERVIIAVRGRDAVLHAKGIMAVVLARATVTVLLTVMITPVLDLARPTFGGGEFLHGDDIVRAQSGLPPYRRQQSRRRAAAPPSQTTRGMTYWIAGDARR